MILVSLGCTTAPSDLSEVTSTESVIGTFFRYQDIRNEAFQRPLSPVHKEKLKKRRIMELTEFLAPPKYV